MRSAHNRVPKIFSRLIPLLRGAWAAILTRTGTFKIRKATEHRRAQTGTVWHQECKFVLGRNICRPTGFGTFETCNSRGEAMSRREVDISQRHLLALARLQE